MLLNMETLAERLRSAIKDQQTTQSELARKLGVQHQQIQAVCSGKIKRPTNIVEMAEILNISPFWLQSGKGPRYLHPPTGRLGYVQRLPVVPWEMIGKVDYDKLAENPDIRWIGAPEPVGNNSYVLELNSRNMIGANPDMSFSLGNLLIVDPDETPTENCYVIVSIGEAPKFRHYSVEEGQVFLSVLNTNFPNAIIEADETNYIWGVVRGAYKGLI
jgi:SOS-response transcriptional repressor LexA